MAHPLQPDLPLPQTAWYVKSLPMFVGAKSVGALSTLKVPTFPNIYFCNGDGKSATGTTGVLD
jgi:hypothetical protein